MNSKNLHTHWITSAGHQGQSGPADARFPYWSFTKTVIAIAALQLVERGKLKLDVPLGNQPYTLRQLLAHTSGLPDYCAVDAYHVDVAKGEPPWPREQMLDRALQNGFLFEPGEGWSYSNIGYMFIGDLIESVSATSLGTVIADNICKPLDLNSVELATARDDFAGLHWSEAENYDPRWVYHRCLTGTASDATRLLHALFSGKLLKPETLEQMLVRRSLGGPLAGRPWQSCGYSLGLMAGPLDGLGRVIGHSGCGPFSVNAVYHFPDVSDPITVSCFTDGTDEGVAEFEVVRKACEQRDFKQEL